MSRNFFILAATLLLFSLVSCGMVFTESRMQPGLPGNGSLWGMISLFLLLGAVIAALAATMTTMFEQVERRNQARIEAQAERRRRNRS